MFNLSLFSLNREGWTLKVSPNKTSSSSLGNYVKLSDDGFEGIIDDNNCDSHVAFLSYDKNSDLLQPLRFKENTEYDFSISMPYSKNQFEKLRHESGNPIFPFENPSLMKVVSFNRLDADKEENGNHYLITGRINFGNHVGIVHFDFYNSKLNFCAEVLTEKLSQEDEYRNLLDELSDVHSELILRLDNPTEVMMKLSGEKKPSPLTEILHFRRLMRDENLPSAISTIIGNPASHFESVSFIEQSAFVTEPDFIELHSNPTGLEWIHNGPLDSIFKGYTPTTLPAYKVEDNYDILENRFVKKCIYELVIKLDDIACRLDENIYAPSHINIHKWREQLLSFLNHPFWNDIGESFSYPNSMVMKERIGYRDFLQAYMSFSFGLILQSTIGELDNSGDLKPIYDLYERWCFLQLHKTLVSICEDETSAYDIKLSIENNGFFVDLKKGNGNFTKYTYHSDSDKKFLIKLYYIRKFKAINPNVDMWSESYSASFNPDFSIEIIGDDFVHWIHFDAKYRLNYQSWKSIVCSDETSSLDYSISSSYKREDLHVMHAYRDALLGTRGCYLLYPGNSEDLDIYVRHGDSTYRKNYPAPSIGAIPLKPVKGKLRSEQESQLKNHLLGLLSAIARFSSYNEEEGFSSGFEG